MRITKRQLRRIIREEAGDFPREMDWDSLARVAGAATFAGVSAMSTPPTLAGMAATGAVSGNLAALADVLKKRVTGMKGTDQEKFQNAMKTLRGAQAWAESMGGGDAVTALKKAEKALLMAIARQGK
jgi:hypothetical protein